MDDGTVVGRALEIVEAVAQHGPGLRLVELSVLTGIPKPTTRRIAQDLVRRQVLVHTSDGYTLGPTLSRLGETANLQRSFADAHGYLVELQAACGGIAWLSAGERLRIMQPLDVVCDDDLKDTARTQWPGPTSGVAIMVNTAGGRVLLANRPDIVEKIARDGLPQGTPHSPSTMGQLEMILREVRDLGACVESEQAIVGWRCAAAGFTGPEGKPAVLGVITRVNRGVPPRMLRATRGAADSVAASMAAFGRRPGEPISARRSLNRAPADWRRPTGQRLAAGEQHTTWPSVAGEIGATAL